MNGVDQIGVVQPGWQGTGAFFVIKPPFGIERPSLLQSTIDAPCDQALSPGHLKIRVQAADQGMGSPFVFKIRLICRDNSKNDK